MLTIGVTGYKGRLGSELVRRGCAPLRCDVTDPAWIADELERVKPDVVVHCAAMTEVDECEHRPWRAAQVNALGTRHLCNAFWGPIVYISTDYIFDGKDGPYDERARPNPLGWYGWSKLGGELAVAPEHDLIVRTTVLFDCYSDNFVTAVARQLLGGRTLTLPNDLTGSPTYVPHLADGILAAVEREVTGIVNLVGWRVVSRYEMGGWIAERLGMDKNRVKPGNVSGAADRPLKAGLHVGRARGMGLPIGDPLDGIQEVCQYAMATVETR